MDTLQDANISRETTCKFIIKLAELYIRNTPGLQTLYEQIVSAIHTAANCGHFQIFMTPGAFPGIKELSNLDLQNILYILITKGYKVSFKATNLRYEDMRYSTNIESINRDYIWISW